MKKNKGFTLIELLAVIVVLAIIALIATPIVLNLIESARKGSAEQSTTSYVKAIENAIVKDMLKQIEHEDKVGYQYDEISVDISGTKPTSGTYTLKDGKVETANFCVNGYNIEYTNGVSKANGKCEDTVDTSILAKAKSLVYENGTCKTDGSTYTYMGGCYIKGASTNNYVWYNGFMWRIMGINSDNTVRLITDENVTAIPYGESGSTENYSTDEGYINGWLNNYFYDNLNSTKSIIKEGAYFCSESTDSSSEARTTCTSGNEVTAKVGILSLDEYLLSINSSSYLNIDQLFWTMTPYKVPTNIVPAAWCKSGGNNTVYMRTVTSTGGVRPVINVESTAAVTKGVGISSNYYVLVENKDGNKTGILGENVTSGEYVKLEGKTYRVVSKDTDGIKLILDEYPVNATTYGDDSTFTLDSGIGQKLNGDILKWLGLSDSDKIVETTWYQGDGVGGVFKYTDVLNSTSNGVQAKVGLIRVGEMLSSQSSTMLTKNYTESYSFGNLSYHWTMNTLNTSEAWYLSETGEASADEVTWNYRVRPVINVRTDLAISKGNGTWNNPYEV